MKLQQTLIRTVMYTGLAATLAFAQSSATPQSGQQTPAASDQSPTHGTPTMNDKSMNKSTTRGSNKGADHSGHMAGAAGTGEQSMVSKQDHEFMTKAAMGGMAEVQLAQMAQQKAASQEVKDYARKLEQDHTKANEKLKAIAQERQVSLPSDIGPEHQQMVSKLNNLSGAEFDRAYIKMMVSDHKKDVKEFEREANRSMDTDLKEFASSTAPTLREHLTAAQQLQSGSMRSRSADSSSTTSNK
jgi:putative membrane protein